ncbi:hypothetical protein FRC15_003571 [Serendipita sp. 397]|nr:hypothetical protein FRC15_003571 [Serendipita sp. 397]
MKAIDGSLYETAEASCHDERYGLLFPFANRSGKELSPKRSRKDSLRARVARSRAASIIVSTMAGLALLRTIIAAISLASTTFADTGTGLEERQASDPCAAIANQTYVVPSKVIACLSSFAFNPTLRDNIVDVVSKTLNFHTSTNYQLFAPPPFLDVHVDIQAELKRIKGSSYSSDFALHKE